MKEDKYVFDEERHLWIATIRQFYEFHVQRHRTVFEQLRRFITKWHEIF